MERSLSLEMPLISAPPLGYTAHFRDPQIIQYEDEYLMVIGGQTNDEKGNILIYRSQNLIDWTYRGPLALNQDLGFMVECPNLLFIQIARWRCCFVHKAWTRVY